MDNLRLALPPAGRLGPWAVGRKAPRADIHIHVQIGRSAKLAAPPTLAVRMPPAAAAVPVVRADNQDPSTVPVASKGEPSPSTIGRAIGEEWTIVAVVGLVDKYHRRIISGDIDHIGLRRL